MSSLDHILQKAIKAKKKPHWCVDHQKWETEKHDTVEPFKNWVEKNDMEKVDWGKLKTGVGDVASKVGDASMKVANDMRQQFGDDFQDQYRRASQGQDQTGIKIDQPAGLQYAAQRRQQVADQDKLTAGRKQNIGTDVAGGYGQMAGRTAGTARNMARIFMNPDDKQRYGSGSDKRFYNTLDKALWKSLGIQKEDSWEVPKNPKYDYMSGREYPDLSTIPSTEEQASADYSALHALNRGHSMPGWSIDPDSTRDWEELTTGSLGPVKDSYGVPHDQRRSAMLPEEQEVTSKFGSPRKYSDKILEPGESKKVDPLYAFGTGMHGGTTWDPFSHGDPKVGDPIDYRYGGIWGGEHGNPNWPLDLPTAEEYNKKNPAWRGDRTLPDYHRNSLDKALWKSLGGR